MKFAWLPCSLILRQEQGSEKETAGVNTLKNLTLGFCLISGKHVLITEFPEQGTHSGSCYYSLLRSDQLHLLTPCVNSNARMANSTMSCLCATVPAIFHKSPLVAIILAGLLTTLFLSLRQSVLQPLLLWSVHSSCRFVWYHGFNMEAILVPITLVLRLTGRKQLALSLASHDGTCADALINSYFFFLF